jgi:hypothetical protein
MFVCTYSKGKNQFPPDMEGIDPLIASFHEPETWVSRCPDRVYPKRGPQHSQDTSKYL